MGVTFFREIEANDFFCELFEGSDFTVNRSIRIDVLLHRLKRTTYL